MMSRATRYVVLLAVVVCTQTANAGGTAAGAFIQGWLKGEDEARERDYREKRYANDLEIERLRIEALRRQAARDRELERDQELATRRSREAESNQADAVQAAINRVPKLKRWQEFDKAMWDRAVAVDAIIQLLPESKSMRLEDRFNKVVRFVEIEYIYEHIGDKDLCQANR